MCTQYYEPSPFVDFPSYEEKEEKNPFQMFGRGIIWN